ncbi:MAG: transposase, partial [Isosphaeraceae bacterium]|nr:transposase [Isosphaeraceae bacterium]
GVPPLRTRPARHRPEAAPSPGRRAARGPTRRRRVPPPSPLLPRLRRRHARRPAAGRLGRGVQAAAAGDDRPADRGLPPEQAAGPGRDGRPAGPVDLRRPDRQGRTKAAAATAEPVGEVLTSIRAAKTLCVDETGWRPGRERAWLWTAVGPDATAVRLDRSRGADALHALVGEPIGPVIVRDRFPTYARVPNRQVCWAHLRRDMQSMIDRAAGGEAGGAKLLRFSGSVFAWWPRYQAGVIHRPTLRGYVAGLRPVVRSLLEAGVACTCPWTAKVCRKLLAIEPSLGTFVAAEGVPPHNNAAERALRHGVIWRKTSHGTDGEAGSRYVERVLTVVATCRQRARDVLGFLAACFRARFEGRPAPSLLA